MVVSVAQARIEPLLRERLVPLPEVEHSDFAAFADRFAQARVVLLGEATHGTSEFYRARAAIKQRLVARHGYRVVAVEADWPDAAKIDRYLRLRADTPFPDETFARFPVWMWRNREILDLARGLRAFNAGREAADQARFRGLDVYSLGASMAAVLDYLDRVDPAAARQARDRYCCLSPWHAKPAREDRTASGPPSHEAYVRDAGGPQRRSSRREVALTPPGGSGATGPCPARRRS
ncbi:erythromycin esterase family protein [Methylobacterium frigidaeris]|uniref:Erythromycin esterase n=1 Tax=Methylobacterium frigidaeris TaxID=2038277 RepID=A0AA37HIM1_9HYPH|nr:erythromycin esterase family protein [Methylobacterium frigidaeris]GJD66695.1 hypothetical protein MPEAHAMD_6893 [Methylobacterium frigidaeris]